MKKAELGGGTENGGQSEDTNVRGRSFRTWRQSIGDLGVAEQSMGVRKNESGREAPLFCIH